MEVSWVVPRSLALDDAFSIDICLMLSLIVKSQVGASFDPISYDVHVDAF